MLPEFKIGDDMLITMNNLLDENDYKWYDNIIWINYFTESRNIQ